RLEHDRLRMQRTEEGDAEMNEGHEQHAQDADDGAEPRPLARIMNRGPQRQVSDEEEEQKQRQGEPRGPGTPGAPDRLGPKRSSREHHRGERDTYLRRRGRKSIESWIVKPEKESARDPDERKRQQRAPRGRHMEVENLLCDTLARLNRRIPECQEVDPSE